MLSIYSAALSAGTARRGHVLFTHQTLNLMRLGQSRSSFIYTFTVGSLKCAGTPSRLRITDVYLPLPVTKKDKKPLFAYFCNTF